MTTILVEESKVLAFQSGHKYIFHNFDITSLHIWFCFVFVNPMCFLCKSQLYNM